MLRRNIGYKMLALVIALIVWGFASMGQNPNVTREMKVPLDLSDVQSGYVVTDAPRTVSVSIQGQRSHIESMLAEPDSVSALVKLRGKGAGHHVLPVKVQIPEGLRVLVRATPMPREVAISISEKAQRTLPIDVEFASPPPVGYRFGGPQLTPKRATVSGTVEQVDSVSQLVAAVDSKDANAGTIDADLQLVAQDKDGNALQGMEITPDRVHIHLELLEAPASRIVFISPDIVGQPQYPYKVSKIAVSPQTIAVTGRPDELGSVTTIRTAPISVAGRSATITQRVSVLAPKGLAIGDNRYVRVTVDITRDETKNTPASARGE